MLVCLDERRDPSEYDQIIGKGWLCTDSQSYADMTNYCEALRTDLKKCLRDLDKRNPH